MEKIKKLLAISFASIFTLVMLFGTEITTINVTATTTNNFVGKLNTTYKSSNKNLSAKLKIKKQKSGKISVNVIAGGVSQGTYYGKIVSKNTIQIKLDGGEKIKLKWKNKTRLTAKRPAGGFSNKSIQMARLLCTALNNETYTCKIPKEKTTYYYAKYTGKKSDPDRIGRIKKMYFKGNKLTVIGSFSKASHEEDLYGTGEDTEYLSYKKRTYKVTSSTKYYRQYGEGGKEKAKKSNIIKKHMSYVIKIKNNKVVSIVASS